MLIVMAGDSRLVTAAGPAKQQQSAATAQLMGGAVGTRLHLAAAWLSLVRGLICMRRIAAGRILGNRLYPSCSADPGAMSMMLLCLMSLTESGRQWRPAVELGVRVVVPYDVCTYKRFLIA